MTAETGVLKWLKKPIFLAHTGHLAELVLNERVGWVTTFRYGAIDWERFGDIFIKERSSPILRGLLA